MLVSPGQQELPLQPSQGEAETAVQGLRTSLLPKLNPYSLQYSQPKLQSANTQTTTAPKQTWLGKHDVHDVL